MSRVDGEAIWVVESYIWKSRTCDQLICVVVMKNVFSISIKIEWKVSINGMKGVLRVSSSCQLNPFKFNCQLFCIELRFVLFDL